MDKVYEEFANAKTHVKTMCLLKEFSDLDKEFSEDFFGRLANLFEQEEQNGHMKFDDILRNLCSLHGCQYFDFALFILAFGNLTEREQGLLIRFAWEISFAPKRSNYKHMRFFMEKLNPIYLNGKTERKILENKPDVVTIYRGCSLDEPIENNGEFYPNWTFNKSIAEFYAFRFHGNKYKKRVVFMTRVKKEKILMLINNRSKEIVVFGVKQKDAHVVAYKPSFGMRLAEIQFMLTSVSIIGRIFTYLHPTLETEYEKESL